MTIDVASVRSRRALLAAALGAGAATVASALGRPPVARAGVDGDVVLGANNFAAATTWIANSTDAQPAIHGVSTSSALGLAIGVRGDTQSPTGIGVMGHNEANIGVYGVSNSGTGVLGTTQSGVGVYGDATPGGTAGLFSTPKAGAVHAGYALRAVGRVRFDQCAGVATISKGARTRVVAPQVDLVSTSAVVATLQGSAGGAVVERVAVHTATNTFTIVLTKATTANVKVAWHVFG